ncbi:MAG: hypothetical protein ABWY57_01490 [Mycetocola sp.]
MTPPPGDGRPRRYVDEEPKPSGPVVRNRMILRAGSKAPALPTNVDELAAAAAALDVEDVPVRRTVAHVLVAVVVSVIVLILLVHVSSQWALSQALGHLGRIPCYGPTCVQIPLSEIESATDVEFPEGAIVETSIQKPGLLGKYEIVDFEIRIPAGLPVPEGSSPWVSEPDPGTDLSTDIQILVDRGELSDIRWNMGNWVTGVEANGDSIVLGTYAIEMSVW